MSFFSCRKLDVDPVPNQQSITEKFLTLPSDANPTIRRIAKNMREQNDKKPFIEQFVKNEGFVIWEKAIVAVKNSAQYRDDEQNPPADTTVTLPVVRPSTKYVKSLLKVKLYEQAVLYKLYQGADYALNGFNDDSTRTMPNADDIVKQIMRFEYDLYHYQVYKITDNRLFGSWPDSMVKPSEFYLNAKLTTCTITFIYGEWVPGGNVSTSSGGDYGLVLVYAGSASITYNCDDGGPDIPSFDDSGVGYTPDPGSGGGGSPDPPNTPENPCTGGRMFAPLIYDYELGVLKNPCSGENIPTSTPEESPDDNGFYPSRIQTLHELLTINPLRMTPCDEIAALNSYGPMFQEVASFTPLPAVVTRLDGIRHDQPSWIVDDYNIENLNEADGAVVNCDFFPVRISQLPFKNGISGERFTPREFLENFRININNFITSPVDVGFNCQFTWFDDCTQWYSSYEGSLGALNSVLISGPGRIYNSGSIILSDYHNNTNTNGSQSYWFTFSTLETPFDGEHPVAGNRRMGIYNTVAHPDEWTFFTMAVDRTWDFWDEFANNNVGGFAAADQLWTNVQENIIAFINARGGGSSFYTIHKHIARPDWDDVKKYLKKEITFQQLKEALGCP